MGFFHALGWARDQSLMAVQPQTKYNEIIKDINTLIHNGVDEFSIRRLQHDAEALVKVDAAQGYMALGAIAALQNDVDSVRNWHEKSLRLQQANPEFNYNYAVSLQRVGLNSEAARYAEIAVNLGGHDDSHVTLFLETSIGMGKFMSALSRIREPLSLTEDFACLPEIVEFMKVSGFTDDDFIPLATQAEEVARHYEIPFNGVVLFSLREEGMAVELLVSVTDPKKLAEMNESLADRMAAIDTRPGVISSLVMYFKARQ